MIKRQSLSDRFFEENNRKRKYIYSLFYGVFSDMYIMLIVK